MHFGIAGHTPAAPTACLARHAPLPRAPLQRHPQRPHSAHERRFTLTKKRKVQSISGDICLGFEMMDEQAYQRAKARQDELLAPAALASQYSNMALVAQLHGINGLRVNKLPSRMPRLTLGIKVSRALRVRLVWPGRCVGA